MTESKVHFVASSGWSDTELDPDEPSPEVVTQIGYCTHAILKASLFLASLFSSLSTLRRSSMTSIES